MREITFRGKTKKGRWVYGDLLHYDATIVKIIDDKGDGYPVDADTVGQFVGLCASDGTKIYEGDFIRITLGVPWDDEAGVCFGEIVCDKKESDIDAFRLKDLCAGMDMEMWGRPLKYSKIKCIGNRWDNPELALPPNVVYNHMRQELMPYAWDEEEGDEDT